jgi:hypothetical protein
LRTKRSYSTSSNSSTPSFSPLPAHSHSISNDIEIGNNTIGELNPYFITGFSDAESSFIIGLAKDSKRKTG